MKYLRLLFIISLALLAAESAFAQEDWEEISTAEDLYVAYPLLVNTMFEQFDLHHPGMEKANVALKNGEITEACKHLLEYYRNSPFASHLRRQEPLQSDLTKSSADTILKNVFTILNIKGKVPYGEDGHRDWDYRGPNNDAEWAWLSNRHHQIDTVLDAYFETGNPEYASYIDLFLRDFILKSQPYPCKETRGSVWRGLEVSFRAKCWPRVFYGLINSEYLSPATRLLILSSMPEHADYLRKYHASGNWLTMELSGLAEIATCFPEYKESNEWLVYAGKKMTESISHQVYPDGVQYELSAHYHDVALMNFVEFKTTCELSGKAVSDTLLQIMEDMYDYTAKSMRPNGFGPLNNDGDLIFNRDHIKNGATIFKRPDWEYIASNGTRGLAPEKISFFYPWAGQLISRSSYEEEAHWSFFDLGPWGAGHQHNDKLHISISAYGRDLLVDAGRFAYTGDVAEKFRSYALSSAGHNTVLIDHKGQGKGEKITEEALEPTAYRITDEFDFATGSTDRYDGIEGKAKHIRSVLYVRDKFWIVTDRILTDRPRQVETLWHWHPECLVEQKNSITKTKNQKGNLTIIPVGQTKFDINQIKGKEEPSPQGWYSSEYNVFEANVATIYSSRIKANTTFVWILQASETKASRVKAKIISETEHAILVKVNSESDKYLINIPYYNSTEVAFSKRIPGKKRQ